MAPPGWTVPDDVTVRPGFDPRRDRFGDELFFRTPEQEDRAAANLIRQLGGRAPQNVVGDRVKFYLANNIVSLFPDEFGNPGLPLALEDADRAGIPDVPVSVPPFGGVDGGTVVQSTPAPVPPSRLRRPPPILAPWEEEIRRREEAENRRAGQKRDDLTRERERQLRDDEFDRFNRQKAEFERQFGEVIGADLAYGRITFAEAVERRANTSPFLLYFGGTEVRLAEAVIVGVVGAAGQQPRRPDEPPGGRIQGSQPTTQPVVEIGPDGLPVIKPPVLNDVVQVDDFFRQNRADP